MKIQRFIFILFLTQILLQSSGAQTISHDTIWAQHLYEETYKVLKNREFHQIDSYIIAFDKTAEIFKQYQHWNGYLDSKCGMVECYARKLMLPETKTTAQEIILKSKEYFDTPNAFSGTAWHNIGLCYVLY